MLFVGLCFRLVGAVLGFDFSGGRERIASVAYFWDDFFVEDCAERGSQQKLIPQINNDARFNS